MNRKKFLQLSTGGLAGLALPVSEGVVKPIIISTWDSGMAVNAEAWKIIGTNGKSIDAVEAGGRYIENLVDCCVGLGGYPDRDGIVTLDASIMEGNGKCGAVSGLEQIKHPISVARKIMDTTPHVMLTGNGAQQFAIENGFQKEGATLDPGSEKVYKEWLLKSEYKPVINIENKKSNGPFAPHFFDDGKVNHDTMGIVAMDAAGKLAGGVTTSGMAFKIHGRVGDSPIIGAGLFVDDEVGAATSSGVGEEVIRICGTHLVIEFLRQGNTPETACRKAVERIIKRDPGRAKTLQVGFVALDKKGRYGAYAIQKGFVFAVKSAKENQLHKAKYLI
ncbi:MAG: N(4)-(beta-N-acetylglucosaminyl)-L-asparaginase [Ferruginibacter sp.]